MKRIELVGHAAEASVVPVAEAEPIVAAADGLSFQAWEFVQVLELDSMVSFVAGWAHLPGILSKVEKEERSKHFAD